MLEWSQSTETTGSLIPGDFVAKPALAPDTEEAIMRGFQPDFLYDV